MKNNEQGRSMIEMLGVLAIIGVLSVGGIAGYSKAMAKYRVNRTIDQVAMVVSGIQTLFANQRDRYIGADDVNVLEKAKIVDSSAIEEITSEISVGDLYNGLDTVYERYKNNPNDISARSSFCHGMFYAGFDEYACNQDPDAALAAALQSRSTTQKVIATPYGGHMVITAGDKIFALNLLEVPTEMCIALATLDWNGTVDGGTSVSVGGRTSNGTAMSVADATAGCAADYNTIVMTFK